VEHVPCLRRPGDKHPCRRARERGATVRPGWTAWALAFQWAHTAQRRVGLETRNRISRFRRTKTPTIIVLEGVRGISSVSSCTNRRLVQTPAASKTFITPNSKQQAQLDATNKKILGFAKLTSMAHHEQALRSSKAGNLTRNGGEDWVKSGSPANDTNCRPTSNMCHKTGRVQEIMRS
jgi:hypothetical protein